MGMRNAAELSSPWSNNSPRGELKIKRKKKMSLHATLVITKSPEVDILLKGEKY